MASLRRHFQPIEQPVIVRCPSDRERRETRDWRQFTNNSHLSYFAGINASEQNWQSVLPGDRNLTLDGRLPSHQVVPFPTHTAVGFGPHIHKFHANILSGDGSVEQATSVS